MSDNAPLSHNASSAPCAVCGEAGRPCARCRIHYYCGKEHQRQHWPKHQPGCGSVALRDGFVVATRAIPAGTVVMREQPSLTFPASPLTLLTNGDLKLLCAGCFADLSTKKSPEQCSRCGFPVCGDKDDMCSWASGHQVECEVFQRAKYKVPRSHLSGTRGAMLGAAAATLRTALEFSKNPLLRNLEQNLNNNKRSVKKPTRGAVYADVKQEVIAAVVRYLRTTVGIKWLSERELSRAALIASMYSEDIQGPSPDRWDDVDRQCHWGCLFAGMILRKHSCHPNSGETWLNPKANEYVVVTGRDVAAGEYITKEHQGCYWVDSTLQRREAVLMRWGFVCDCERCRDPTELGLYVGSPCCPDCRGKGKQCYLVPIYDNQSHWRCQGCGKKKTVAQVKNLTKRVEEELEDLNSAGSSPAKMFQFLERVMYPRGPVHPTHAVVLRAHDYIRVDIFNRRAEEQASPAEVDRWEEMIRGQLRTLDRLLPGTNESRIQALLELRRLVLGRLREAERKSFFNAMMFQFIGVEAPGKEINQFKDAVLEVNKELCRHHFNRDEDQPKRSLIEDPFGGR